MTDKLAAIFLALTGSAFAGENMAPSPGNLEVEEESVSTDLNFGRAAASSDLPGYVFATATATYQFESDYDELPGQVSAFDFSLWTPVAHFQTGDIHVVPLLGLRTTQFDTSVDTLLTENALYAFRLPIVMVHDVSKDWIYGGMVMPSFSGDLSNSDNFSISAAFGLGRQFNSKFMLGAGVYYSRGFEDDLLIPGLAFIWRPTSKWEAYLLGPVGGISYAINENWIASLYGQYDTLTWNVEDDSLGPERNISSTSFRLGLKLERRLSENFWMQVTGGISMLKEITIEDTDGRTLEEDEINSGPFVQIGGNLRF